MKVHFIGIGGTGMGGVAQLLRGAGHEVRGADTGIYPPMSDQLQAAGIPVANEYAAANLDWGPDCVVVGNVCRADHVEVVAAQARGIPLESFPSALAKMVLPGRQSLVVAGTHGKTTTTSLLSWILRSAGHDPTYLVGGVPLNLGQGAAFGKGEAVVLEGDEYDTAFFDKGPKFMHYGPRRAILTSVEFDHADIFGGFDEVREVFGRFVESIDPRGDLVVNMEDSEALGVAARARCNVVRYRVLPDSGGDAASAEFAARRLSRAGARRTTFELFENGDSVGELSMQLYGRYNLGNALAAAALARRHGVEVGPIKEALRRFRGVKKRQELLGMAQGVRVIFDFAHHPTAASLTTTSVRRRYPEHSLHVCFEPRSSSSHRRAFAEGFGGSFDAASHVYIAPLYRPEKVPEPERLDCDALASSIRDRGVDARALPTIDALATAVVDKAVPGDTVLLLSSGDFGGLGPKLLRGLGDPVCFGSADELPAVNRLLSGYDIPTVLDSDDVETLVMRGDEEGQLAGTVSLQANGDSAFLFGLAVTPERRGEGLGWVLGDCVLRRSRTLGVRRVYLVTSAAADFFGGKLGFRPVDVDAVDAAVRQTTNFAINVELPDAVCMVLDLPPEA
ncbi:MAG: GNAT family N-acetyltransferase [Myxococcota bacterium]